MDISSGLTVSDVRALPPRAAKPVAIGDAKR